MSCRGEGVAARTRDVGARARCRWASLNLWRVNLERCGVVRKRVTTPKLVELVVATTSVAPRARFVLRVGGVELEVGDHFDDASLRRLVGVLKSC